jgi:hypothetical protein
METDEFDGDGLGVEEVRPCCENGFRLEGGTGKSGSKESRPSKMTPKEPSPIFLPTR